MTYSAPAKPWFAGGFGTYRYQVSSNDAGGAMSRPPGLVHIRHGQRRCERLRWAITSTAVLIQTHQLSRQRDRGPTIGCPYRHVNRTRLRITADRWATTRCPMRIPGASAWRRHCLPIPLPKFRMWAAPSRNQLENGANGHINDANPIPYGSFFTPDPITGALGNPAPLSPGMA